MITAAAKNLSDQVAYFAQFRQRAVTLKQLFDFGLDSSIENLLRGARFLHKELPVRLAHRIRELDSLPFGLSGMPSVVVVKQMYVESFRDLVELPCPEAFRDEERFTETIENIKQRHNNVVSVMARGIQELRQALGTDELKQRSQAFFDKYFESKSPDIRVSWETTQGFVGMLKDSWQKSGYAT